MYIISDHTPEDAVIPLIDAVNRLNDKYLTANILYKSLYSGLFAVHISPSNTPYAEDIVEYLKSVLQLFEK